MKGMIFLSSERLLLLTWLNTGDVFDLISGQTHVFAELPPQEVATVTFCADERSRMSYFAAEGHDVAPSLFGVDISALLPSRTTD
jgi:hypothetical protein